MPDWLWTAFAIIGITVVIVGILLFVAEALDQRREAQIERKAAMVDIGIAKVEFESWLFLEESRLRRELVAHAERLKADMELKED